MDVVADDNSFSLEPTYVGDRTDSRGYRGEDDQERTAIVWSAAMILDEVTKRTLANMEIALERACDRLPGYLSNHEVRKTIAIQILERAKGGEASLEALTDAALTASATFSDALPCRIDVAGAALAKPLESK